MRLLTIVLAVALSLAGGCALSPQTVAMRPFIDVAAEPVGRRRTLALAVVDRRPDAEIGRRGGVYETASISPRNDIAQAVFAALAERLGASGFQVVEPMESADLALDVAVLQVDYRVRKHASIGSPLVNEIQVGSSVQATLRNGEERRAGRYQANSALRRVGYPSAEENEEILNEVVSQALRQLLQDPDMRELLGR